MAASASAAVLAMLGSENFQQSRQFSNGTSGFAVKLTQCFNGSGLNTRSLYLEAILPGRARRGCLHSRNPQFGGRQPQPLPAIRILERIG